MALEGLFPDKDETRTIERNVNLKYPKLREMLDYIVGQRPKLLDSTEMTEQKLLFPSKMYVAMINFLLKCFEEELEQINFGGKTPEFQSSVDTMCLLLEHAMAFEGSVELHSTASKALVTIASHLPEVGYHRVPSFLSYLYILLRHCTDC